MIKYCTNQLIIFTLVYNSICTFPHFIRIFKNFMDFNLFAKTEKILDLAMEIFKARHTAIKENSLNKFLNRIVKIHRPTKAKGIKRPRIYELTQVDTNPPVFKVRISQKDTLNESYLRFIENQLRKKYDFLGTPINIYVERNKNVHGRHEDLKITKL